MLVAQNTRYKVKPATRRPQDQEPWSPEARGQEKLLKAPDATTDESEEKKALRELDLLIESEGGILTP